MHFRLAVFATLLASASLPSFADTYPVRGGTSDFSGTGTITATATGSGSYQITGVTGNGVGSLLPAGGYLNREGELVFSSDNILYPGNDSPDNAKLDGSGFAFTDTQGDTDYEVDIFASGNGSYQANLLDDDDYSQLIDLDFELGSAEVSRMIRELATLTPGETRTFGYSFEAVAPTPEPSAFVLLGTGFLGIAGLLHRQRN